MVKPAWVGSNMTEYLTPVGADHSDYLRMVPSKRERWCMVCSDSGYYCTRAFGHLGDHAAHDWKPGTSEHLFCRVPMIARWSRVDGDDWFWLGKGGRA